MSDALLAWKRRWAAGTQPGQVIQGRLADFSPPDQQPLRNAGVRVMLQASIFVDDAWWGIIGFDDSGDDRRWTHAEVEALRIVSHMLGIAIQRKRSEQVVRRLYETEREQRSLAQKLQQTASKLSATLDFEALLNRILDQISALLPYDTASVLLLDGPRVRIVRSRGFDSLGPDNPVFHGKYAFEWAGVPNLSKIIENKQPLVIPDVTTDPKWVWMHGAEHVRSWIGIPIVAQDRVIAIMTMDKMESNFYRPSHADLLVSFADQAALALQNASLFAETLETLRREQRLNEVTHAISSALDLDQILQTVVRLAVELVGAGSGILGVHGGGRQKRFSYTASYPENVPPAVLQNNPAAWEVFHPREPVLLGDEPGWTLIAVPLAAGEQCFGVLCLFGDPAGQPLNGRELRLAESVGRQAGIAVQNARRFNDARQRAVEAEMLRHASAALTSTLDLQEALALVLVNLEKVVPYNSASIFLIENDAFKMVAGRGFTLNPDPIGQYYPIDDELFNIILRTGRPLILRNASKDPRYNAWGGIKNVRGWMGVPLLVRGEIIGMFSLDNHTAGAYSEADAVLVQAFANDAASVLENARLFSQVQQMAVTDPLTGLFNRRYLFEAGGREVRRALRYDLPLSAFVMDIDHFKRVNDRYGHLTGDRLLRELAAACKQILRDVDILARYGGEEFVVLLPQTALEDARQTAERMRERVANIAVEVSGAQVGISVSIGVAQLGPNCQDLLALLQRADLALYSSKEMGRGMVQVWSDEMDSRQT
jgi:diguanylate cyclase (GGDEF)-like protein